MSKSINITDKDRERRRQQMTALNKSRIGKPSYNKGKHPSEITINKIRLGNLGKKSPSHSQWMKENNPQKNPKVKENTRKTMELLWQNEEYRKKALPNIVALGKRKNKKFKFTTEINKDPEFIKKRLNGLLKRPTKPEQKLIEIIQKHNFPFIYTGNGKVIIENKCPDFVDNNGSKKIIEVFGRTYHDPNKAFKEVPFHKTEQGTIEHYKKYGFSCLIIWEDEFQNEQETINKINCFLKS